MNLYFYMSETKDGYLNLARDEYFLDTLPADSLLLYFYINGNAVIIGRNQNPWSECDLPALEKDGVQLVRRKSGGGAVYHDSGNLNFSFIASENRYDEDAQNEIIISALTTLGIKAEKNGRNDMTADGRKFSGNAFYTKDGKRQRHGTLLISSRLDVMGKYLNVDPKKLKAKGVSSVRSRVCNLSEIMPGLDTGSVSSAIKARYEEYYAKKAEEFPVSASDTDEIEKLRVKRSSFDWVMGEAPMFDYSFSEKLSFGMVQFCVSVSDGKIKRAELYTDSLDIRLSEKVREALLGEDFSLSGIAALLRSKCGGSDSEELAAYIESNL